MSAPVAAGVLMLKCETPAGKRTTIPLFVWSPPQRHPSVLSSADPRPPANSSSRSPPAVPVLATHRGALITGSRPALRLALPLCIFLCFSCFLAACDRFCPRRVPWSKFKDKVKQVAYVTSSAAFVLQSPVVSVGFARFHPNLVVGGTYSGQIVLWDNRSHRRTPVQRTPLSAAAHTVRHAVQHNSFDTFTKEKYQIRALISKLFLHFSSFFSLFNYLMIG